jgi:hypothetical protein
MAAIDGPHQHVNNEQQSVDNDSTQPLRSHHRRTSRSRPRMYGA